MTENTFERIEKLESMLFLLNMKDHWNDNDWNRYYSLNAEINKLRENLQ